MEKSLFETYLEMAIAPKNKPIELKSEVVKEIEHYIDKYLKEKDTESKKRINIVLSNDLQEKLAEVYPPTFHWNNNKKFAHKQLKTLENKYERMGWYTAQFIVTQGKWILALSKE